MDELNKVAADDVTAIKYQLLSGDLVINRVNSLTHLGHREEGDSSMNVWWLGPFQLTAWGENWHQNHHSHAGSARLGLRWYQTDIGWYFIWMLEAVGLAHSVKRPRIS